MKRAKAAKVPKRTLRVRKAAHKLVKALRVDLQKSCAGAMGPIDPPPPLVMNLALGAVWRELNESPTIAKAAPGAVICPPAPQPASHVTSDGAGGLTGQVSAAINHNEPHHGTRHMVLQTLGPAMVQLMNAVAEPVRPNAARLFVRGVLQAAAALYIPTAEASDGAIAETLHTLLADAINAEAQSQPAAPAAVRGPGGPSERDV